MVNKDGLPNVAFLIFFILLISCILGCGPKDDLGF
jgi:hypothetical protein